MNTNFCPYLYTVRILQNRARFRNLALELKKTGMVSVVMYRSGCGRSFVHTTKNFEIVCDRVPGTKSDIYLLTVTRVKNYV